MSKVVADQADGLRRLLAPAPMRIVAIAGMAPGMGATTVATNLAAALVQQGKEVLLLDEHHPGPESACQVWRVEPRGTLADVVAQRASCEDAAARTGCGARLLPVGDSFDETLAATFDPRLLQPSRVVLIDAALDRAGRLSALARVAGELVLVLRPHPSAITVTYSGIKQLHYAHGLKQLRFLLNGVADMPGAQRITQNMADTGSRYLGVSLQVAGSVQADLRMSAARYLNQTVVEAFPASLAAADFRRIADDMGQWPWRPATLPSPSHFQTGTERPCTPHRELLKNQAC